VVITILWIDCVRSSDVSPSSTKGKDMQWWLSCCGATNSTKLAQRQIMICAGQNFGDNANGWQMSHLVWTHSYCAFTPNATFVEWPRNDSGSWTGAEARWQLQRTSSSVGRAAPAGVARRQSGSSASGVQYLSTLCLLLPTSLRRPLGRGELGARERDCTPGA
jgi:hypothetical protein